MTKEDWMLVKDIGWLALLGLFGWAGSWLWAVVLS